MKKAPPATSGSEAPEALRRSEEKLRLLVDSVEDYAMFVLDETGHIESWNPGAQRIKGYAAHEIIGKHFSTFYTPEDIATHKPDWELETAKLKGAVEDEGWRVRKDGTKFWANVVITALRNPQGEVIGFAKVTRDMSERRKAEEALREARDTLDQKVRERTADLQETNRELEEFAYVVSHDLQEPIRKILIFGERLQEELKGLSPQETAHLAKVVSAGHRLRGVVHDLLQFSRLTQKAAPRERLNLADVIAEAQTDLELQIAEAQAHIVLEKLPDVNVNRSQFRHVFQNLLSNAVKFRRPGQRPEIRISTEAFTDSAVTVAISDNGIGFDEAYKDKIFLPFQRLHAAGEFEGTGIGLSIVKKIVIQHGGRIEARSTPGEGTTFLIQLPRLPDAELR